MLENLIVSLNAVLPFCIILVLGYVVKHLNILDDNAIKKTNNLVFKIFLPVQVFMNIYTADILSAFNASHLIFAAVTIFIGVGALTLIVPLIVKENSKRGVIIQGCFRSNYILFALPIVTRLYGPQGAAVASILIATVVPLYNILAIIILEKYSNKERTPLSQLIVKIVKNPLIIGCVVGAIATLIKLEMPQVINDTMLELSAVASPLMILLLGTSFNFTSTKRILKPLIAVVFIRLIFYPMIFISIAVAFGFRGIELSALMLTYASPTSVTSYLMAGQMGGDAELAGNIVVYSTILSAFTIFLWIFTLKQFGLA